MPNPTNEGSDPKDVDHEHHKICVYHSQRCNTCPDADVAAYFKGVHRADTKHLVNTYKKPTYRHTAKPPWVDFEKQRELVPGEHIQLEPNTPVPTELIRLKEKLVTCRITFNDREPERSDSGKAITIHQCEAHLVIITWDES